MNLIREEKVKKVEEIKKLIEEFPVVGIADVYKFPSKELQELRKKIRDVGMIKFVKKSVLLRAIKESKKEKISELGRMIPNNPILILCREGAFKFYSLLSSLKFNTYAKESDTAPNDVIVKAGKTNLMPGPVISELSKAGIVVGVEEGRIVIKKDVVLVKKGEKISKEVANALRKLEIKPISIGLNVVCFYENGNVYPKEILELVEVYKQQIPIAHQHATNLSLNIFYPTKHTIKLLLIKAFNNATMIKRMGGV
ncbi:MAG: 50S ribosomal protein L10 [Candidatus Aenigmatarchaeota archaeon]